MQEMEIKSDPTGINEFKSGESYQNEELRVLNESDTFAIFDSFGHVNSNGPGIQGIYFSGTRYLSRHLTSIESAPFVKLSSTIREKNDLLVVDLTNPFFESGSEGFGQGAVHVRRMTFVRNGSCYTKYIFYNFSQQPVRFRFDLFFDADFKDIFEIRGIDREKRGSLRQPVTDVNSLKLSYVGLDNILRTTKIESIPDPAAIDKNIFRHLLTIDPGETRQVTMNMHFFEGDSPLEPGKAYEEALSIMEGDITREQSLFADLYTSNEQFTHWINRSKTDLQSLLAYTKYGLYPYAGVPWYNTAFGRDGILTAYATLWVAPEIARNTLLFLAATQATAEIPSKDAEPGKIFHEMRSGEMANTGEVPFDLYYGTIDATPLYIMLAGAYYERTGDLDTCKNLWSSLEAGIRWMETYGDPDGDGFLEYRHKAENGLTNQGWKDSHDAISYENGELAEAPIALAEVQGYAYAAYIRAAAIARDLGKTDRAVHCQKAAASLKKKFNKSFWDEELSCFVMALDKDKQPCRVVSSNAGQCLFTGIATDAHARKMAATLLSPAMYCGWGIRTLSSEAKRYNPMSYHNGSVWPHDVSLIADGFARYGLHEEVIQLVTGLFNASLFIDLQRMPELFCGFQRRSGEGPTNYPVACSPQAWSVGAVFLLVKACLRLKIDALNKTIYFRETTLPDYLDFIRITGLYTRDGEIDLEISRYSNDIGVRVVRKPAKWMVVVEK